MKQRNDISSHAIEQDHVFGDLIPSNVLALRPRDNLAVALDLAERGFPVFPCAADKRPRVKNWTSTATAETKQIRAWWSRWPDALPGLPMGGRSGLAVLDLDRHHDGQDGVAALVALGHDPETLSPSVVETPSGGLHLYFAHVNGLTNAATHLPDGIDIRAHGGFVIAPGTQLPNGRTYGVAAFEDLPEFPKALRPAPRELTDIDLFGDILGEPEKIERGKLSSALPAIANADDRDVWFRIGAALHHESSGADWGFDLWCDWSKQSDKFDVRDQKKTWRGFGQKANGITGATVLSMAHEFGWNGTDVETEFQEVEGEPEGQPSVPPRIAELNQKMAFVHVGGKARILVEREDGFDLFAPSDVHALYENDRVRVPGSKRTEPVSKAWMRHTARRQYPGGIVFRPDGGPSDAYNLWRGWAVAPDPSESCNLFLDHLRDVVCAGSERDFKWLVAWLAHIVQRPEEKPGTAVVLRGEKGAGKDTVGRYFGMLCPRNRVSITQPEHLTGRFNGHLANGLLLHMEEGFWAGDHAAESVLKNLITGDRIQLERKGVDPVEMPHFARLLITSNAEWVVPATAGERRFFVLDVSADRARDTAYFAALDKEMNNGGPAALLDYLRGVDLSGVDLRKPPETAALTAQKLATVRNVEAWWRDRLYSGSLTFASIADDLDDEPQDPWAAGNVIVGQARLYADYADWLTAERFQGSKLSQQLFARRFRRICPVIGEQRPRLNGQRVRQYELPSLSECREAFAMHIGGQIQWDE